MAPFYSMSNFTPVFHLDEIGVCPEAIRWVSEQNFPSLEAAWLACERGDWMLFYAGKKSGDQLSEKRRKLEFAATECACVNTVSSPAAVNAARDAAYSLYPYDVCYAVAGRSAQRRCADIVRKHYPTLPS